MAARIVGRGTVRAQPRSRGQLSESRLHIVGKGASAAPARREPRRRRGWSGPRARSAVDSSPPSAVARAVCDGAPHFGCSAARQPPRRPGDLERSTASNTAPTTAAAGRTPSAELRMESATWHPSDLLDDQVGGVPTAGRSCRPKRAVRRAWFDPLLLGSVTLIDAESLRPGPSRDRPADRSDWSWPNPGRLPSASG